MLNILLTFDRFINFL